MEEKKISIMHYLITAIIILDSDSCQYLAQ